MCPFVPGTSRALESVQQAKDVAAKIGYPVMLKAAAGGGGKGMRLVHSSQELQPALEAAQSEAQRAFGDGEVYLEKAILNPRHIEMQVLADEHGNTVYLGERECSIQRRHQKVLEEAPSPRGGSRNAPAHGRGRGASGQGRQLLECRHRRVSSTIDRRRISIFWK